MWPRCVVAEVCLGRRFPCATDGRPMCPGRSFPCVTATLEKLARVYRVAPDPPPCTGGGGSVAVPGAAGVPCGATLGQLVRDRVAPDPPPCTGGGVGGSTRCRRCTVWRHSRKVGAHVADFQGSSWAGARQLFESG